MHPVRPTIAYTRGVNKLLRTLWRVLRSRRRPPVTVTEVARLDLRVRPTDIDVLGHMNNGVYLSIADLGRLDLLARCGMWAQMRRHGWYSVVQNATITYRRSLDAGQRYTLETRFVGVDERSVYVEQRFVVDGQIAARLHVRWRFLRRGGGNVPMPEFLDASGLAANAPEVPGWIARWNADVALPPARTDAPSVWE